MNDNDLLLNFFYAIFIGIIGSTLLIMFFFGFMTIGIIERFLPFIVGFNAALTGYNLISRIKDRLRYKRIWSLISGMTMVVGVTLILNIAFYYYTDGYFVYMINFLFLAVIGGVFSWIGAALAIKYFNLDTTTK